MWPYCVSDALAATPDYKDDIADYTDFLEYQVPQKILEKKVRR